MPQTTTRFPCKHSLYVAKQVVLLLCLLRDAVRTDAFIAVFVPGGMQRQRLQIGQRNRSRTNPALPYSSSSSSGIVPSSPPRQRPLLLLRRERTRSPRITTTTDLRMTSSVASNNLNDEGIDEGHADDAIDDENDMYELYRTVALQDPVWFQEHVIGMLGATDEMFVRDKQRNNILDLVRHAVAGATTNGVAQQQQQQQPRNRDAEIQRPDVWDEIEDSFPPNNDQPETVSGVDPVIDLPANEPVVTVVASKEESIVTTLKSSPAVESESESSFLIPKNKGGALLQTGSSAPSSNAALPPRNETTTTTTTGTSSSSSAAAASSSFSSQAPKETATTVAGSTAASTSPSTTVVPEPTTQQQQGDARKVPVATATKESRQPQRIENTKRHRPDDDRVVWYRNDEDAASSSSSWKRVPLVTLLELGYCETEIESLLPTELNLIATEKIPRPRTGVPSHWMTMLVDNDQTKSLLPKSVQIVSASNVVLPEEVDAITNDGDSLADTVTAPLVPPQRRDRPQTPQTTPRSNKTKASPPIRDPSQQEPDVSQRRRRRTETPTVAASFQQEQQQLDKDRSRSPPAPRPEAAESSSPPPDRPPRRSREERNNKTTTKERPMYSGRPSSSARRQRASAMDEPPPPKSGLWPDLDTFRSLLRDEAGMRLRILGKDWSEAVKEEADWRLDLYKNWLWTLHNGVGEPLVQSRSDRARRQERRTRPESTTRSRSSSIPPPPTGSRRKPRER